MERSRTPSPTAPARARRSLPVLRRWEISMPTEIRISPSPLVEMKTALTPFASFLATATAPSKLGSAPPRAQVPRRWWRWISMATVKSISPRPTQRRTIKAGRGPMPTPLQLCWAMAMVPSRLPFSIRHRIRHRTLVPPPPGTSRLGISTVMAKPISPSLTLMATALACCSVTAMARSNLLSILEQACPIPTRSAWRISMATAKPISPLLALPTMTQ